jgi:glutathione synthase/RimK-type ligase-like ATP-grasp enzyme
MSHEETVLIVSTKLDNATDAVVKRLATKGVRHYRLNTEDYPFHSTLSYCPTEKPSLVYDGVPIGTPTSIWYRRMRTPSTPVGMDEGVSNFCRQEARSLIVGSALAQDARWMSHPARVWEAENKPYQLRVATQLGLSIPKTLISNDPETIESAFRKWGRMVIKPVRSGYVVNNGVEYAIYTSELLDKHFEDFDDAIWSPSIYQQLVPKRYDLRITIVGDQCFAVAIDSQSDPAALVDWRQTENPDLPHHRTTLPKALVETLKKLMARLGLTFGAIDLIETTDGGYVFLEVNPSGQWLWLDEMLDLGISDSVANWLTSESS